MWIRFWCGLDEEQNGSDFSQTPPPTYTFETVRTDGDGNQTLRPDPPIAPTAPASGETLRPDRQTLRRALQPGPPSDKRELGWCRERPKHSTRLHGELYLDARPCLLEVILQLQGQCFVAVVVHE